MSHDAHDTAHGHDAHGHDAHGHDSHGGGHGAANVPDGPTGGPGGWPVALLVGIAYLAGSLYALFAH